MHQDREGDAHGDRADQDREEDERPDRVAEPHRGGQQRCQQQAPDDLEAARDRGVDERVPHAVDERRLARELGEVVEADELDVEQRPAREAEPEREQRGQHEQHAEHERGGQVEPVRVAAPDLVGHRGGAHACPRAGSGREWVRGSAETDPRRGCYEPWPFTSPAGRAASPASPHPGRRICRALFGRHLTGADIDGDLLQRRGP